MTRVAVVSTPRAGNIWFGHLIAGLLGTSPIAGARPASIADLAVPDPFVVVTHVDHADAAAQAYFAEHGFRIASISRHPLDVLVSMLRFVQLEPAAAHWLGMPQVARLLRTLTPADPRFAEWCCSDDAARLLGVSRDWSAHPGAITVRYEELVADPVATMRRVAAKLGADDVPVAQVVAANATRFGAGTSHGWRGRAGNWTRFLGRASAQRIRERHAAVFAAGGYTVEEAGEPSPAEIQEAWDLAAAPDWERRLEERLDETTELLLRSAIANAMLLQGTRVMTRQIAELQSAYTELETAYLALNAAFTGRPEP